MAFDPMQMMMLLQGAQGLADNFSAARRGVQPPQQGGGMQEMVPMMAMMQRGQAANAEMELERQKMAMAQADAARQQENMVRAAKALGVDPSVLALNMEKFGENAAERVGVQTLSPGQRAMVGDQVIADNPALLQAEYGGVFDPRSGGFSSNPEMQRFDLAKAAAGAARNMTTVDARNMSNGFDAMLGQAMEERKAMVGKTEKLNELAALTGEMADIAVANPTVFDPAADVDALMTQGEAILKKWSSGNPLTPEQTQFLSAYNRAKQLNVTEGFNLVANLKPISEAEVKLGLQTALGPGKPVPQVLVRSVQAQLAAKRQADLQNEFDRYQAGALEAARRGGDGYSPAAHRLHMMEWEKANPVSQDAFQDVLATLSKKLPYGGGGEKSTGGQQDDPLGLLAP